LPLVISSPTESSAVYQLTSADQNDSFNLSLNTSYPPEVKSFRGDAASSLRIIGETTPDATFSWKLDASTNPTLDTCAADYLGSFDCALTNITAALIEGRQVIWGQSYKGAYYSPWTPTAIIRDINPPTITDQIPTGSVPNLRPMARAKFVEEAVTAGRTPSGLNTFVMRLSRGTTTITHDHDLSTGYVTWVDSTTNLPPLLSTGSYTIVLEGGDNAKYNARSTWTFTIDVGDFTDNSKPSVDNKTPSGMAADNPPTIYCDIKDNQSGINIETIVLKLDGAVVVSSGVGNLFSACSPLSPQDGYRVTHVPGAALSSGWHSVTVVGAHWANDPADKIWVDETWQFWIP
jgi:hypothetical protein